jgi:isopentenyldiphosphate isomerase
MSEEEIETFDSNGNSIGKHTTRSQIHSKELWHQVAHVWIVNKKKEILLQKRSKDKKQYANVWHISAAGHIAYGEIPINSAARETAEEIGLNVNIRDLIYLGMEGVKQITPETGLEDKELINTYLFRLNSAKSKFILQNEEVKELRWITLDELESDIKDKNKYKNYLNHPKSYYLNTIKKIRKILKSSK